MLKHFWSPNSMQNVHCILWRQNEGHYSQRNRHLRAFKYRHQQNHSNDCLFLLITYLEIKKRYWWLFQFPSLIVNRVICLSLDCHSLVTPLLFQGYNSSWIFLKWSKLLFFALYTINQPTWSPFSNVFHLKGLQCSLYNNILIKIWNSNVLIMCKFSVHLLICGYLEV